MKEENKKSFYKKLHESKYLKDWEVVLFWILSFETLASIIEYSTLSGSEKYIDFIPDSIYKELAIALMIVFFVVIAIYNLIFITRKTFLFLLGYTMIGVYLLVTSDMTFGFLFHNINFIEVVTQDPLEVILIQLVFKVILVYLTYRLYLQLTKKNKPN